jgi:hypothetical protein
MSTDSRQAFSSPAEQSVEEAWSDYMALPPLSGPDCLKPSSLGAKEERGATGGAQPHMSYSSDGKYIREAACHVYRKWTATGKGA